MSNKTYTIFKIRDKRTGMFSGGGVCPHFCEVGSSWESEANLRQHLFLVARGKFGKYDPDFHEIVEVEVTERELGSTQMTFPPVKKDGMSPPPRDEITTTILRELNEALEQFGTYAFDDKGANEIMVFDAITARLRAVGAERTAKVLRELMHAGRRPRQLACQLTMHMDDWDELFAEDAPWAETIALLY